MATKKPFTDEQKDMLMDYLFNKFMNDMMQQKERSEDIYNQPPSTDAIGNEVREAKSNNAFMDMIDKGVNNTKKEGIMTAQQYKQGGDLNYVIEMMKNETDPDKLEELKMQIREMLGTTPYMSIRQDPVRKANEGGDAKEENPLRQFRDDYEMLIGFPSEVLREESKVKMRLLDSDIFEKAKDKEEFKKIFYDEYAPTMKFLDSLSDEERKKALDIILSKRAEREIEDAETEGVGSLMRRGMAMADGGIISLAEGGDPLYEMFEEVWKNTPASERATGSVKKATVRVTGDPLSYRNFLKDLGFIKTAEAADVKALGKYGVKIGDKIGSISEAARALNIKPFELRSDENFAKLVKLAEDKGVKGFQTVTGAGKASISAVEDAATGIGFRGADPGGEKIKFNQVLKAEQKDLNKIFGSNPSKAKSFEFVKRLSSTYPTLVKGAGLTALLSAAAKNAFGGPLLDLAIPTEMGIGTMMSPEDEALLISKEKIKEKFK
jgi:hypothetical protein